MSKWKAFPARIDLASKPQEDSLYDQYIAPHLQDFPKNVRQICRYGFTEMCNNAIDHSGGAFLDINLLSRADLIDIRIKDDGVGIFKKLSEFLGLTPTDAILSRNEERIIEC